MKPRILVAANLKKETYVEAVEKNGGEATAVYCPEVDLSYDGLILCGGNDSDPKYYGEEINGAVKIDYERDRTEIALARAYIEAGKPIMGICRGHQLLNIILGGTIVQHLENYLEHQPQEEGQVIYHSTNAEEGSLAYKFWGEEFETNSYHHQAINKLGDGLKATAFSNNGTIIEAIEHESLPIIGVQWHPERMCEETDSNRADGNLIFKHFIDLCKGE